MEQRIREDKPSVFSKQAQYKPPHSSQSESDKTSEKSFRKEKKEQFRLRHERSIALNVASTARKDLSHLTCFNSDKKGHYATKCPEPKKDRDWGISGTSED